MNNAIDNVDVDDDLQSGDGATGRIGPAATTPPHRPRRRGIAVFVAVFVALAVSMAVLSVGLDRQDDDARLQSQYLEIARGGVMNLLTISASTVDQDIERLLGNASGAFAKDLGDNADNYKSVVVQAQVTSAGEIVEAAVENTTDSDATVLIAAQATVTNSSAPEGEPRSYRLRVSVSRDGDRMTISDVQFVA